MSFFTVRLDGEAVVLLDQRRLPEEELYLKLESGEAVARAIEDMAVRGAPAIGVAAAMGVAVELARAPDAELEATLYSVSARLARTRPTAVNLRWALERMRAALGEARAAGAGPAALREAARAEAQRIADEDVASCRAIGDAGAALVPQGARVLTHCNAGALATAGYGTALGVVRSAARAGRLAHVVAQETRPFLQGARLTAWELSRDGIPVRLITDSMGGALMARKDVDLVVVGADRIAANGDVANKIGTYTLAVLARAHGLPFYVAAPFSTVDLALATGAEIPIEERSSEEVTVLAGRRIAPEGVVALHPAFDVTPADFVTAIITERGVVRPPFAPGLAAQSRASGGR
ncbi:MAG TPA: S-methyl-5-thioribose-1-phosphate isomerase [Myxococcota bacterium]|nr:S-methyl-5-thioribose-1-phosphate isomerase [Myxococcota bacterium]